MSEDVDWEQYLTGNTCPICYKAIARSSEWIACDGCAEHKACHDADLDRS